MPAKRDAVRGRTAADAQTTAASPRARLAEFRSTRKHTPQEEKNRELIALIYKYHAAEQDEQLLDLLTDDCVYVIGAGDSETTVPYHGRYEGKEQIAAYLAQKRRLMVRPFCGLLGQVILDGPWVVCMGTIEDQFKASRFRIVRCPFLQVWAVDEVQNKVFLMEYFIDTAAVKSAWQEGMRRAANAEST